MWEFEEVLGGWTLAAERRDEGIWSLTRGVRYAVWRLWEEKSSEESVATVSPRGPWLDRDSTWSTPASASSS